MNYIFSNLYLHIRSLLVVKSLILLNFFIIFLFLLIADYYDLKFGIIPNKLSLILLIYGFIFNWVLAALFKDSSIFIFSLALTAIIMLISFILWYIGFWGGGDFKLFVALSFSLSLLDLNHLNLENISFNEVLDGLNLAISNQRIFYPKVFSIIFNSILIAFLFIFISILYRIIKDKKIMHYSLLSLFDFNSVFSQLTTKLVDINDLSEGMVLKEYYFKEHYVISKINDEKDKENSNINLNAFKGEDLYHFSSKNMMGLTEEDILLINELYEEDLIKNPNFKIKIGIPFMPFITAGYLCFLIFGDFIAIVSSYIKLLF